MANRFVLWVAISLIGAGWNALAAQTFVAFGLTNVTIGNATYSSNAFQGPFVSDLGSNGTDGLSIDLGEADSGVFVYPSTYGDPPSGSFMAGHLYGSVNGETNRLICLIRCHEQGDGYHPVAIDFSSLGPIHLTFQAFRYGSLVAQTGPQPGPMVVYGDFFSPYYPRVNPFWRMRDGSVGALIEFPEPADVSLPGVGDVSADRVFIRADNPTNVVDFTSRLEITAQLPYFEIYDARLGVFNRPHKALGNAHLHARPGILNVANFGTNHADGLAIELEPSVRFDLAFTPIQLDTNELLTLAAVGNASTGPGELSAARIARTEHWLELSAHLDEASNTVVVVYSNGVPTGTAAGTNAIIPATAAVVGCEFHARIAEGQAGIVLRLDQNVSVTLPDGTSAPGDEIRFTGSNGFAALRMLALNSTGLEEFTIVSETEYSLPAPQLQIVRSGDEVELSWIDPYRVFNLEFTDRLDLAFYSLDQAALYAGDKATVILQIDLNNSFYRLSSAPRPPDQY
jgi:hypothetical protein